MTARPRGSRVAQARAEKTERARARARLGRLRDRPVKAATLKRYRRHVALFYSWRRRVGRVTPSRVIDFDTQCSAFAEELWESGDSRSVLGNTLSAFSHFIPSLRGQLPATWRLYGAWGRTEMPNRAPCIDVELLHGLSGYMLKRGHRGAAVATLAAHHCCWRTSELLEVRTTDITLGLRATTILLRDTKMGGRIGVHENCTVKDAFVLRAIRNYLPLVQKGATLVGLTAYEYRKLFGEAVCALGLPRRYKPYGLRRGGATCCFQASGRFDLVADRGRWQSLRAMRVYITTALQELAADQRSVDVSARCANFAKLLHHL